ncbi:hypothetical protein ABZX92_34870 [Lentzea sp. NPDC006480]|uniref:hypothetical protein n=1 Tax=Lentzea sp. NPDC006480 TaxID=3157176 RepID=UPI0033A08807
MRASLKRLLIPALTAAVIVPAGIVIYEQSEPETAHATVPRLAASVSPPAGTSATAAAVTSPTGTTAAEGARIAKFDPATRTAVVQSQNAVSKGDVIASPPVDGAPKGVLVKVADTKPAADGVEVRTEPATVADVLGDAEIDSTLPVAPKDIAAVPLTPGVQLSVKGPGELTPSRQDSHALASVRMDLDVPLPSAKLKAWVELQPEVIFSYHRDHALDLEPAKASVGLAGAYDYGWRIEGALDARYDTGRQPLRLPFAELNTTTTFWVGPVPIVVSAKLNYFFQLTADGKITIETEQRTTGQLVIGAEYAKVTGWQPIAPADPVTRSQPAKVTGAANAKAVVGANAEVFLYDTVGVTAQFAPHVRASASQSEWALHLGFELTGSLDARLRIFGMTARLDFPALRKEWRVAGTPVTTTSAPAPSSSSPAPSSPAPSSSAARR